MKFSKNSCKNSNLGFHSWSISLTKIPSSIMQTTLWYDGTSHCEHKTPIGPTIQFNTLFTNFGQPVVSPNYPKFITNSKFLKIFSNLHLWHMCKVMSMKIINVNKQSFSTNPLSKLRYDVSRSCPSTPISYLWTINWFNYH